jgi:hypothetical protein
MTTHLSNISVKDLYAQDFNLWLQITAKLLLEKRWSELDIENLVEEIETLGRSDKRQLQRRLTILIAHLLYLTFWYPEDERKQCARGWKLTIIEQRNRIQDLLSDSPSLKPYLESIFTNCYEEAREDILYKSNYYWDLLPLIPEQSPFLLNEVLESAFSEY